MLSVVMLRVIMLSVVTISILMYSVVILRAVMLAVAAPQNQFPENEPRFFFHFVALPFLANGAYRKKWG
jgi:hypothetical protein